MIEEDVIQELKLHNYKITTAESCTGGMIASMLVNVAGASDVFDEAYITYANEAKHKLLGVKFETLSDYGAVSSQVAEQMAFGAAKAANAQVSVAVTGIAGPGGGTKEKPVGLVYIGCYVNKKIYVEKNQFGGNRLEIRQQTAHRALQLLLEQLRKGDNE